MNQTITSEKVPAKSEDVLATDMQDVAVLMSMDSGKFVELNETARAVWELVDGSTDVDGIVAAMCRQFEVSEDKCRASVTELLARMHGESLITLA